MTESEWKKFKKLKAICLERFCERVLANASSIVNAKGRTSLESYHDLYRLIQDEDKKLEKAFDGLSRSRAFMQLLLMYRMELVEESELDAFEAETRNEIRRIESR
jgi:hypothetical protein